MSKLRGLTEQLNQYLCIHSDLLLHEGTEK